MSIEQSMENGTIIPSPAMYQQVFEKQQTLRDVVEIFATNKGVKISNIDEVARNIFFVIDGVMHNSLNSGGIAKLLDIIVKPTQLVQLIPALKAG